jgi:hypothetical protein
MERAVSKSKGVEFGSLVHQLGADYLANPFSPQVRDILLAIDPAAAKRFPVRRQPRPEAAPAPDDAGVAPSPATPAVRKKKSEAAAPVNPVTADAKTTESKAAAESKAIEGKKSAASSSKKPAEAAAESPAPGKLHDKSAKIEKGEKSEKQAKPEKPEKFEKIEKPEKRSAEAAKNAPAADGLGKRKPR